MISLSKQCTAFLRLAQGRTKEPPLIDSEEEYKWQLQAPSYTSAWDVFDFIARWKTKPFFKIQDVISLVKNLPEGAIGLDALSKFAKYPELIDIAAEKVLEHDRKEYKDMDIDLQISTYLHLETLAISEHIIKSYQRVILTTLMKLLGRLQEDGNEWWFKENLKSLSFLFQRSTKFPKSLLEGLFKRFGLENYTNLISTPEHYQAILKKDVITKWDAAIIIRNVDGWLVKDAFLNILNKCDDEAKEYFRGFIYDNADFRNLATLDEFFMLSEDMTPMDLSLKQRPWPRAFWVQQLSNTPDEVQAKWGPIFADFSILTH